MQANLMGSNIDVNIQPGFTSKKLRKVQTLRSHPLAQVKVLHNVAVCLKVARTVNGFNFTILSGYHLMSHKSLLTQMICLLVFRRFFER